MRIVLVSICLFALSGCNVFFGLDSVGPDTDVNGTTTNGTTTNGTTTNGTTTNGTTTNGGTTTPPPPPPQMCESSCSCADQCTVDCADCDVVCERQASCSGIVTGTSTVQCGENASCDFGCASGSCTFECLEDRTDCAVDCSDGAECVLDCRSGSPPGRKGDCEWTNCADPIECEDDLFVCNRACPGGQ